MPDPTSEKSRAIHIDAKSDGDRLVVLTPENEDRFVKSCQWVVEASKLRISRDVWLRELHHLLTHVHEWAQQHAARIKACMAAQRDDQIAIYVVPSAGVYDFDLSDEITRLDLELAEKFQACQCDVLQVPESTRNELYDSTGKRLVIHIYGEQNRTSVEMVP
jgi:hypothetical protein